MRQARRDNDRVVVSLFVNPLQFGPHEDYARYPRPFRQDCAIAHAESVDVLWVPTRQGMYPRGHATRVEVLRLGEPLCGRWRPGHFRGVATIVAKLFGIVQPHRAYFGQKDAQQVIVIRRMVKDLHWPVTLRVLPTVRERDGLALSSRNASLTAQQRQQARQLFQALSLSRRLMRAGERRASRVRQQTLAFLRRTPGVRVEYVELVDPRTLRPLRRLQGSVLVAVAAWVGRTRLIDNLVVHV